MWKTEVRRVVKMKFKLQGMCYLQGSLLKGCVLEGCGEVRPITHSLFVYDTLVFCQRLGGIRVAAEYSSLFHRDIRFED